MLTAKAKKELKGKAHALRPIVQIGCQGLTEAVHKEVDRALNDHELIKVRSFAKDRALKTLHFSEICEKNGANLVGVVGNVGIVYRQNKES